jgi:small-conductance mechanosensitive channel
MQTFGIEAFSIVKSLILIIAGLLAARYTTKAAAKLGNRYTTTDQTALIQKAVYFLILSLFIIAALQQLGFRLSVLLGSAGILTAALAFASQTSISNIISGIFLIMEKSFKIGDRIIVGSTTGTVVSIDLLSVKILTSNNTLIRIPNETLIKSEITNVTKFDTRRLDLSFKVSAYEDLSLVKKLLIEIAKNNKLALKNPLPTLNILKIDSTGTMLQLSVWVKQNYYDELSDSLYEEILASFKEQHIQL